MEETITKKGTSKTAAKQTSNQSHTSSGTNTRNHTKKQSATTENQSKTNRKSAVKQDAKPQSKKGTRAQKSHAATATKLNIQSVSCADYTDSVPRQKKIAVIVGASSGIGYHTALALCKESFTVYNISRNHAEPQFIQNMSADVCKADEIAKAIATVYEREGRIDSLIYSAGWSLACPLEHIHEDDFRKVFEVNYFGLIKALWAVIPIMRAQGEGRIVAVSSLAGSTPVPFDTPYSASKAAIDMTLKSLAIELYPYNIKITSIQPGGVHTRFTFKRKIYGSEQVGTYAEALSKAAQKVADAEQNGMDPRTVAAFIANLLSEKNPPLITPVGIKDRATQMVSKILPMALTDYLNRMAWE